MTTPLLVTKFYIPPTAPDQVSRPRLLEQLDEGLLPGRPLILISAPAGYGKTTLLSEWVSSQEGKGIHFAWLSLEPVDSDPVRFFAYLAAALEKAVPGTKALIEDLLAAPELPAPPDLAAALINPLAGYAQPLVIVLDDYQVIQERSLQAAITFLIEHLPPSVHLVLATRSDPPLQLHRLRARGQLVELRLGDLRFDREETSQLLNQVFAGDLSEQQVAALDERTEGWAAGLRLLLLSQRSPESLSKFLSSVSGSNRYILDYLTEEALNGQSEEMQAFLLQTAVLDRLCAPLCDVVTGQSNGQEMLETLERVNCFLIPLDEERTWYRYHHLFSDLLRVRLKQQDQRQPGLIDELHQRAAAWLEENGYSEEAIHYYVLVKNYLRAAQLVESRTLDLFARGRLHQLLSWTRLLPEDFAAQRPQLAIYQAWALVFAARLPETEQCLQRAEQSIHSIEFGSQERSLMQANMRSIRSMMAVTSGDMQAALALTTRPDDDVPVEAGFARSVFRWSIGYVQRMKGDLKGAEQAFEEVLQIGYDLDNLYTIVSASIDLGAVLRQQGEMQRAEKVYRAALARAYQTAGSPGYVGRLESFLAYLLIERGETQEAAQLIERAIAHNESWVNPNHGAYTWMVKARLALLQNQPDEAQAALAEADTWMAKGPIVPTLRVAIEAWKVRLWLASGALERAADWLAHLDLPALPEGAPLNEMVEVRRLTAARVWTASGKLPAARDMLLPVEASARRENKISTLIEALVLLACAAPSPAAARELLREALTLGLPRGFRQVILDEGECLLPVLESCQDISGVSELLFVLRSQAAASTPPGPLTGREVEILRWVASGLSNREIGSKLYISAGTVKAHTAAIYRKLDVANRIEAIARAKELGLL